MSTARGPPLDEWKRLEETYLKEGLSRYKSHRLIGGQFNVSPATVYLHLTPAALERQRQYQRTKGRDRELTDRRREQRRSYRKRPEVVERARRYQRSYKQAYRHIAELVDNLPTDQGCCEWVNAAARKVYDSTGILMKPETVQNALHRRYPAGFSQAELTC